MSLVATGTPCRVKTEGYDYAKEEHCWTPGIVAGHVFYSLNGKGTRAYYHVVSDDGRYTHEVDCVRGLDGKYL